jgi:hypothetical protein
VISRSLSSGVALAYLTAAYFLGGGIGVLRMMGFLALPMACIWFGEAMGAYTGYFAGHGITTTTPGCIVTFGGWLLLALPLVVGVFWYLSR